MSPNKNLVSFRRSADYLYETAMRNIREENYSDALDLLTRCVELEPEKTESRVALSRLYAQTGRKDLAERLLLDAMASDNRNAVYCLELARISLPEQNALKTRTIILNGLDICADGPESETEAHLEKMLLELNFGNLFDPPELRRTERCRKLISMSIGALDRGDGARAVKLIERAVRADAGIGEAHVIYGAALLMCGRIEEAMHEAIIGAARAEGDAKTIGFAAKVMQTLGSNDMAEQIMRDRADGEVNPEALRTLSRAAAELAMYELSAECAKRALRKLPFDRELLHMRAAALINSEADFDEAIACWQKMIHVDPSDTVAEYYLNLGKLEMLSDTMIHCNCEVPPDEAERRRKVISRALNQGLKDGQVDWVGDDELRKIVHWGADTQYEGMNGISRMILALDGDQKAISRLRHILYRGNLSETEYMHICAAASFAVIDMEDLEPIQIGLDATHAFPKNYWVGEKQMLRCCADCMQDATGEARLRDAVELWKIYREAHVCRHDVLTDSGAASTAVAMNVLGEKVSQSGILPDWCKPNTRRVKYYDQRIKHVLKRADQSIRDR